MKKTTYKVRYSLGVISVLILLSGCKSSTEESKNKPKETVRVQSTNSAGKPLLKIGGRTVITDIKFEDFFDKYVESNAQLKQMIQFIPNINEVKKDIFNVMVGEEVMMEWAKKNKITEQSDYKKDLESHIEMIKKGLAAKYFQKTLPAAQISDNEIKKYYNDHKAEFIITPAGIKAQGVYFENEAAAKAFVEKAKNNFIKEAKSEKTFKDFGVVNNKSFSAPKEIKEKILKVTKFPSIEIIKSEDKKFWVVNAEKKAEAVYRELDEQMKKGIEQLLKQTKFMEEFQKRISKLKKQYNVIEDASYFEEKKEEEKKNNKSTKPATTPAPKPKKV